MRIVITRPTKKALYTQEKIKEMGCTPIMMPLSYFTYDRQSVFLALQEPYGGIAITSSESLSTLPVDFSRHSPLFVIGEASSHLARQKGFSEIFHTQDNSIGLAKIIVEKKELFTPQKPLIYLGGNPRSIHFENYLRQHDVPLKIIDCYCSWSIHYPEIATKNILHNADFILFYSRSAVSYFFHLPLPIKISAHFLCLSKNIASAIPSTYMNIIAVARFPKENSLLDLLSLKKENMQIKDNILCEINKLSIKSS
ncbi:uroporphyrinogen-III synthase [Candidatus Liberibacter africanus]|uniref:Uroporphyrinogen-III synthase n=1 Tax=Candidatus Liberibacter africanus PTSAPSY TaxID=1277257 RepID=A0A0G3I5L9_LIBAF|nr:uroporphyrinogen-III synthase [Candidatus Liberibacter africanus]AKK20555.1 uroporphyrinogen-III synthase [Candidatus Liberibacter africanus PTSAPSY]QTP64255.1 uroporphyrinogen-III synthase [Candidatus Liberibacter africanus]